MFVIRTDYVWVAPNNELFPVYMIAGYRNLPQYFEEGRSDFRAFLDRLALEPPRQIPEALAEYCGLTKPLRVFVKLRTKPKGDATHADVIGAGGADKCLEQGISQVVPLAEARELENRELVFVYQPVRRGDESALPELPVADKAPTGADPAEPAAAEPAAAEAADAPGGESTDPPRL